VVCSSNTHHLSTGGLWSGRLNPDGCVCRWRRRNLRLGLLPVARGRRRRTAGRHLVSHRGPARAKRQRRRRRGDGQDGLRSAGSTPAPPTGRHCAAVSPATVRRVGGTSGSRMPGGNRRVMWTSSRVTSSRLARFEILKVRMYAHVQVFDRNNNHYVFSRRCTKCFAPVLPSALGSAVHLVHRLWFSRYIGPFCISVHLIWVRLLLQ